MYTLLTYKRPPPDVLTPDERQALALTGYTGPLYLSASPMTTVLRIDVWTGRTLGFLHGYKGCVFRS